MAVILPHCCVCSYFSSLRIGIYLPRHRASSSTDVGLVEVYQSLLLRNKPPPDIWLKTTTMPWLMILESELDLAERPFYVSA